MKKLRTAGRILWDLLKELSDEAAYKRHLAAHGRRDSGEEWRRFSQERQSARFVRPKCC
jgi:hypothetical protein